MFSICFVFWIELDFVFLIKHFSLTHLKSVDCDGCITVQVDQKALALRHRADKTRLGHSSHIVCISHIIDC